MKNVESYKITVLDTTYTDLREKYQERYAGYSNSEGLGQFRNPAPIELNMAEISMVVKLNRTL